MSCLLQMDKSDLAITWKIASPMLLEAVAKAKDSPDQGADQTARQTILSDLHDPDDGVRASTVDALDNFGGTDMIPALKELAANDRSREVEGHSIRKSAAPSPRFRREQSNTKIVNST